MGMQEAIEAYKISSAEQRQAALRTALAAMKCNVAEHPDDVAAALQKLISPELDYSAAEAFSRVFKLLPKPTKSVRRLAILGGFTTHQLADFIQLFLFATGVPVEIYESDYGVFQQEIFDPSSGLHAFKPDVIYLAVHRRNMGPFPDFQDGPDRVNHSVTNEVATWESLWQAAHQQLGCQIIQNNFEPAPWRAMQNHETRHHAGTGRFIARVNEGLQQAAPVFVTIHDVDHLSASAGRWAWGEERFYFQAKLPCAPQFLVEYAHSVASVFAAQMGHAKKCMVLDLDNTLWGGIIGEDGLGKIRIGQGEPEGEAFLAFQQYVHTLMRRGVILAVCSKNQDTIAREVFEKHSEMVLRLEHISCFVANWQDKATNLRHIAKHLDIGLNSLVFVDDNPAERALVRQLAPEVAVPELPEDPSGYIQAIERHAYFQAVSVGSEDLQRTEMYRANARRQELQSASGNLDDFLGSIQMVARVEPVGSENLERVVQLIARSNQFNLTTRRHGSAAVMAMADDPKCFTRAISLTDRFGDNGLICVLLAKIVDDTLLIDTWLMSCRVLKRGVEAFLLNHLTEQARQMKLSAIVGEFIPTPKNELVRNHFSNLGFEQTSIAEDGHSWWRLNVEAAPILPNFISEKKAGE